MQLTVTGTDVEALFPSLCALESDRIASEAVMTSSAKFENIDYDAAIRYLLIVGGASHLKENGLGRYTPKWLGGRPDLLTIGGEGFDEEKKWGNTGRCLSDSVKRKIIAKVIELAVILCMGTHLYTFGDKLYLKRAGGPIGMRFTASLANLVMKMWDQRWTQLLTREGIVWKLYVRYVDNCRLILPSINRGWVWNGYGFEFVRSEFVKSDVSISDEHYTTDR